MYRVQVTKEERVPSIEQTWKVVADSGNEKDGGKVYDYVPCQVEKTVMTDLLDLRVEELNLAYIVQAALGLVKT